jgi:hypothetical protein
MWYNLEVENIINYKYEVAFHWCAHVAERFKNTNKILFIYKPDFRLEFKGTVCVELTEYKLKNK